MNKLFSSQEHIRTSEMDGYIGAYSETVPPDDSAHLPDRF